MSSTPPAGDGDRRDPDVGSSSSAGGFPPSESGDRPDSGGWGAPPPDQSWQSPPAQDYGQTGAPAPAKTSGVAIASLVLGILALLSGLFVIGGVLGLIGLILGIIGIKQTGQPNVGGRGMAIAGLVTSVIGVLLTGLVLFGVATLFSNPEMQDLMQQIEDAQGDPEAMEELQLELEELEEQGG